MEFDAGKAAKANFYSNKVAIGHIAACPGVIGHPLQNFVSVDVFSNMLRRAILIA